MSCKPTVGETRACGCNECVRSHVGGYRVRVESEWQPLGGFTRIVEVAPENRAKVTAGPAWMGVR